ncbi:hypothetical protein DLB95_27630 [Salmonella enterica subsp. diarizonae]|uniref:Uncharacterized protein n=1 Tax=Salmonella diarizonae TaxID=59204 RepID=A0A5Y3WC54_SALDZ|nr:hypothetical protein [Salmonella enterica subsp. diarizonae]ECJ4380875.1 hypothetical protein [Salmonella enterica subsp. diarizonae]
MVNRLLVVDGYQAYRTMAGKTPGITLAGFRVDEDVTALIPHRPGRAQLTHPVLHYDCFTA